MDVQNEHGTLKKLNRQFHQLAQENRSDAANVLKNYVHAANTRYDTLLRNSLECSRSHKCLHCYWGEFCTIKKELLIWLTEANSQVDALEHQMSSGDSFQKLPSELEVSILG